MGTFSNSTYDPPIASIVQAVVDLGSTNLWGGVRAAHRRSKFQHLRFDQPLEILVRQAHQLIVRPCIECNLVVFGQALIHEHWHVEQVSERRHCAGFTAWKSSAELGFAGEGNSI